MSLFNDAEVYQKCKDLISIEWFNESRNKPKLRIYCIFKRQFDVEPYVKNYLSKPVRSRLAQFRTGILPMHIETGRFQNVLDDGTGLFRKMRADEIFCKICNEYLVEDELHFLFVSY